MQKPRKHEIKFTVNVKIKRGIKLTEICKNCGLPKELCVCGAIAKESAKIRVFAEKKSFGKWMTVIVGLSEDVNPKELTKKFKTKLACGGTYKNGRIELQGDHTHRIKKLLIDSGFSEEQIEL